MRSPRWLAAVVAAVAAVAAPAHVGAVDPPGPPGPAAPTAPADCGLEPPGREAIAAPPRKRWEPAPSSPAAIVRRVRPVSLPGRALEGGSRTDDGFLAGKTVYLSPGHGWTFTGGRWTTQRGNTNAIVEDLVSAETVAQYLVRYLTNAGAHVVPVREIDLSSEMAIVDDVDRGPAAGRYEEQGDAALFSDSSAPGFGHDGLPLRDGVNPFEAGGNRLLATARSETARALFSLDVPRSGFYDVSVGYSQFSARATDAHYIVRHPGGEAHFRVNQQRHGGTWVRLGRFWLEEGLDPERGSVALANDSQDPAAANVSADVVRIGGGLGLSDRGGGFSGRPRYEEAARYHAPFAGAPTSVYDRLDNDRDDDVATRSRFSAFEHEAGEDAVYVAWHTNAPSPARGTSSYVYGPNPPDGSFQFTGVAGSDDLARAIHRELVADVRAAFDPGWVDLGVLSAFFGELNPAHNPEMPSTLLEVAFHDTVEDAAALKEPRFRRIAARAIYQGIARYFAGRDRVPPRLSPEPPTHVTARSVGPGRLAIAWRAPGDEQGAGGDPAEGYRVYRSADGRAFDEGIDVLGGATSLLLEGLAAGVPLYLRICALNPGGESLPSEVVAVAPAASGAAAVLIVGGFDRLDGGMLFSEDLSDHGLGAVRRFLLARANDGSYAVRHGEAIAARGVAFDGATDEAVAAGELDLGAYRAVDWFAGEESTADRVLDGDQEAALRAFVDGGGRLLLSGAEVAFALAQGAPDDRAFLTEVLHAGFAGDDAESHAVAPGAGPLAGVGPLAFDDGSAGSYDADFPDQLLPLDGADAALAYQGGLGGVAATAFAAPTPDGPRVVLLGFPFETITDAGARHALMEGVLDYFGIAADVAPPDGAPPDDGAATDAGMGAGCACALGVPPGRAPRGAPPAALLLTVAALLLGRRRVQRR